MIKRKFEKGSAIIIGIILVLLVASGAYWFYTQNNTGANTPPTVTTKQGDSMMKDEEMEKEGMMRDNMDMSDYDYYATLIDVTKGNASGTAYYNYIKGEYSLYATFENLPELEEGYFYEGWVVRKSPLEPVSTGALETRNGMWINEFTSTHDLMIHKQYVLTLEPDDGDPAPADHVLDGTFESYDN